ncbi:S-adenosylmethionine mitochondrial carrier protein-like [Haliotis rubra]|uniref:S-adenosylmethionine mitochondrial carrier protein-like n=1 Tax=Haliotis rubra TaxID=36100 RepID=UPI001EE544A5|nr:S-adenosylmethionine mitochondrial carrier protein-like [Haliotis rubra]
MKSYTDFKIALVAGACAGTSVDVILFPLDTIKTRLQSQHGFRKAGGFRGIYSGLMSAALGSAPTAALFFCSYEATKHAFSQVLAGSMAPVGHMAAASLGEVAACLIRVPVEVVKQRTQANHTHSSLHTLRVTLASEGFQGLYRGYFSTVAREVPFSFIQFPLWEYFKMKWSSHTGRPIEAWQSAVCGAAAGGLSAGVTTPLDVAKTRIMLAKANTDVARGGIGHALRVVHAERGVNGLFAGITPRVAWISIGGAVFLGVYEKVQIVMKRYLKES